MRNRREKHGLLLFTWFHNFLSNLTTLLHNSIPHIFCPFKFGKQIWANPKHRAVALVELFEGIGPLQKSVKKDTSWGGEE